MECSLKKNWYSIISLILSLIAISVSCPRQDLSFDYIGVIVGIQSLLVSALIGWNIFSALDVNKRVNKMERKFTDIDKMLDEVDDLRYKTEEYSMGSIDFVQGIVMMKDKDDNRYDVMYKLFISSMMHYLRCDNQISEHLDRCMDNMEQCLEFIKQITCDKEKIDGASNEILQSSSSEFSIEQRRRFYSLEERRRNLKVYKDNTEKQTKYK